MIEGIIITPLRQIIDERGKIMHMLKATDPHFMKFGEIYFSWVEQGAIKAWKCHQRMTLNLVVPMGDVSFVFHLTNQKNNFRTENIGEERYARLTVPPGIWFGFQGVSDGLNLICNVACLLYTSDAADE